MGALADVYPGSVHVRDIGLSTVDDRAVWEYAQREALIIVSKDSDFHHLSFLYGAPPKVVWVRRGNCSTAAIESILRSHAERVRTFNADSDSAFLELW